MAESVHDADHGPLDSGGGGSLAALALALAPSTMSRADREAVSPSPEPRATLIDLFAGCGGGSMGFARRGFRVVAAVELDPDTAESYGLNVGVKPIVRDIRSVTGQELLAASGLEPGQCTVIFGCPPCQSFTVLRRGASPTDLDVVRETLPSHYVRLVADVRPAFVAFENVPGMVEGRGRVQFDALIADLERLGYRLKWDFVDAADYGVPQHRRRVLVIGSRIGEPVFPARTHGPASGPAGRRYRTVRDAIGDLPALESGEVDPGDDLHRARKHSDIARKRLAAIREGGSRTDLPTELQLACHRDHNGHYDVYGRMAWDKPAPTITSGCTNVTRGRFAHPSQDRAITLREAMSLQTFPRTATLSGTGDGKAQQVGNAVPTLLAERIAEAIIASAGSASGQVTAA